MLRLASRLIILAIALGPLAACGNEPLLLSLQKDTGSAEVRTLSDGAVLSAADGIPIQINSQDSRKSKDLELEIDVYARTGEKVWSTKLSVPALNEPLPAVKLPDLTPGQYRLDTILTSAGDEVQKKSAVFFASRDPLKILGITSFPPVITTSAAVLLKADLGAPSRLDPYLRWSWRGNTVAEGLAGKGFSQILWTVPGDEGVYTITLELFPVTPIAEAGISFRSSVTMSTDVYVTAGAVRRPGELGPAGSYHALYRFQGSLRDEAGMKKQAAASAEPIGSPEIVALDRGFGYRLKKGSGFRIPWFVLPTDSGSLRPFTLSLGVSLEEAAAGDSLLSVRSADGGFSLMVSIPDGALAPQAVLSAPPLPDLVVPSGATLVKGERHLLSLSVAPSPRGATVQWFVDGLQTNAAASAAAFPAVKGDGETGIAGRTGFAGTVDSFSVYARDADGRAATDAGLFARFASLAKGDSLALAEGFDGVSLPQGFTVEGGEQSMGFVSLPPGSSLTLPPLQAADGVEVHVVLAPASSPNATFRLFWEGDSTPFFQSPVSARDGELWFSRTSEGVAVRSADGTRTVKVDAPADKPALVARLSNPKESKAALVVDRVLALTPRE